jgi:hypothetical protein|tara:strand:+ start:834 stop:989 length:156 start_codon:yes stop_codon:yes gene_type:complete
MSKTFRKQDSMWDDEEDAYETRKRKDKERRLNKRKKVASKEEALADDERYN